MTAREKLIAARALVKRGWTQGDNASSWDGQRVPPHSPDAVAWCVVGAMRAVGESAEVTVRHLFMEANHISPPLTDWNDAPGRTQAEVLAAFDRAIEAA